MDQLCFGYVYNYLTTAVTNRSSGQE